MGDKHQPYLNGAYYGPSVPPPLKPNRRYKPPGCCCCFNCIGSCLRCCGCCILSLICNILVAVAVILAVTALLIWLIFRPNAVKFYVTDASLNRFSLDSNNNSKIHYDLDLNFTVRNPNQRLRVYYDAIQGQNLVVLEDGARVDLKEDDKARVYSIDVKLVMSVRFRFWVVKSWKFKPKIKCNDLKVPLVSSSSTSGFRFKTMECDFDFY
ncbi:hypothetical protein F2Q68_00032920 [Brassica cretica]|uniref:Late embryogenesis abundant protein LEA-2 subgroup domain-containing protein n=1 Tax=Brassica cretica TaxID=69181 RepID=A0A8S9G2N5_BRACR|nr:hypothetical protein F2Q68_00032920 [Brassica cretica]